MSGNINTENVSLKAELQRHKDLNIELVKWIKEIPYELMIPDHYWGSAFHEKCELLIKKSHDLQETR